MHEWGIIELQGDLEVRGNDIMENQFIGDLNYDKYGQPVRNHNCCNFSFLYSFHTHFFKIFIPSLVFYEQFRVQILIIGHHILHGKEQKMEKPFAVLEKMIRETNEDDADDLNQTANLDTTTNRTVLDSTIAIEHKSQNTTEYRVQAIVRKKLIFKTRPKPIIANVAKTV